MKNVLLLPIIYLATASYISASIIIKPIVKRYKQRPKPDLQKLHKAFYMSRR